MEKDSTGVYINMDMQISFTEHTVKIKSGKNPQCYPQYDRLLFYYSFYHLSFSISENIEI